MKTEEQYTEIDLLWEQVKESDDGNKELICGCYKIPYEGIGLCYKHEIQILKEHFETTEELKP